MKRLYFDTETTGFPAKAGAPLAECPHIVQLAAILIDDEAGEVASINTIIKPNGWTIPEEAAAIHGITTEKAEAFGVPIGIVMPFFHHLCHLAGQIVAHNLRFDIKFAGYEFERLYLPDVTTERERFCTMLNTTDICRLPGRYGKFKWPKLIEAHLHFFGESFDGAHDALVDVRACQRVHRHLLENNLIDCIPA